MGENIVVNFKLGTIQNDSFVPIIETDSIKSFEENNDVTSEETTYRIHATDDFSFTCECKFSKKSHIALERLCLYGWRSKMPFRKRLLRKAINDRVKRDWRRFVNVY